MKKLLSLFLAISILISLIPAISATEESIELSGVKLVYDIASGMGDPKALYTDFTYKKSHNMWEYAASRRLRYSWADNGYNAPPSSGSHFTYKGGLGIAIRAENNNWWAIKINVPVAGYYQPYAHYGTYHNSSNTFQDKEKTKSIPAGAVDVKMNYYLVPVTEGGAKVDLASDAFIKADNLIGSVNCTNVNGGSGTATDMKISTAGEFEVRKFEKGEYYIIFVPTAELPAIPEGYDVFVGTLRGIAGNFILDGGEASEAVPVDMEVTGTDIDDLSAVAYMSDGTVVQNTDATYTGYDENIISVDKNGIITRLNQGVTDITVTVSKNGVSVSKTVSVTEAPPKITGLKVTYDIARRMGSATSTDILFTDFTYKTNNDLWEYAANRRSVYSWQDGGKNTISGADFVYQSKTGLAIRARNNWWAIKIRVNEGGMYLPTVSYGTYANMSAYQINKEYVYEEDGVTQKKVPVDVYMNYYLIPVTQDVGADGVIPELKDDAFKKGDYLIGSVLCSDTTADNETMKEAKLAKRNIQAGEYYFVYMPVYESPVEGATMVGTLRAIAGNLTLDGVNNIKEAEISADTYDLTYYTPDFEAKAQINVAARKLDGKLLTAKNLNVTYKSLNLSVAEVEENGVVTGVGDGPVDVEVTVSDGTVSISDVLTFNVTDMTGVKSASANISETMFVREKKLIRWVAEMKSGNEVEIPLENSEIMLSDISALGVAVVEDGILKANAEGSFTVSFSKNFRGEEVSFEEDVTVVLHEGKTEPTYYTNEMREVMRENIQKYDWAKKTRDDAAKAADKILGQVDVMYKQLHGEGIPRARYIGIRGDDYVTYCHYCGFNNGGSTAPLTYNPVARPWKVQCTQCKRLFPSNDFESFYELGRDGLGYFDVARAREAHHKMLFHKDGEECTCEKPEKANTPEWYIFYGYGHPDGYLYNEVYKEIRDSNTDPWGEKITWNDKNGGADLGTYKDENGNVLWQGGDMWGVDDGWGYRPGRTYADGIEERQYYVAYYSFLFWTDSDAFIKTLADAYLYTGDLKYGRPAAIMLDKIADVFPDFNVFKWNYPSRKFYVVGNGTFNGALLGSINDSYLARNFCLCADILYPVLEDEELIRTLAQKAEEFGNERNDKTSSVKIWQNWAERLVHTSAIMCQDGRVGGNFGQAQNVAAIAAIILDTQPETDEILEWVYKTGEMPYPYNVVTGGNVTTTLIDNVDRDGMGNEVSPRYNTSWLSNLTNFAKALSKYTGKNNYNPYENLKFAKMHEPQYNILLTGNKHPTIGDSGSPATVGLNGSANIWMEAFMNIKDESLKKKAAQYLYILNGGKTEGLKYDIFTKNPERAGEDIAEYVDEDERLGSLMLTGYGFAALRDGENHKSANDAEANNTHRDFWIWFGRTEASHAQMGAFNLGIDAFGLDLAPDLGYPEATSYTPNRKQWVSATISHNTVVVNEENHKELIQAYGEPIHGFPKHFDDAGKVKVMDIEYDELYDETENYRRTLVMVETNDDVSYGIDFFRVTGGNKHTYSFHSQAENAYPVSGLELTKQVDENGEYIGTYAGVDGKDPETGEWIEYGPDPWTQDAWDYEIKYPRGYTWMKKVRRDKEPAAQFTVEFDVQDYRKVLKNGKGIKLRMTQLNNFTPDEVAIVGGHTPQKPDTGMLPKTLDYVLVQREGENLDSLFTTVFEPYRNTPYITSIEPVEIQLKEGTENEADMARAVKVSRVNDGKSYTDYVVYATNTDAVYTIKDKAENGSAVFDFSGFAGVYTLNENDTVIYRYVNDGTLIGEETGKKDEYTGTVTGFQRELAFDNYIDVNIDCDDLSELADKYIYINNDGVENGVYRIISATDEAEGLKEGEVRLDIGTVTLIRGHKDKENTGRGYVFNIKEGQTFSIPISFVDQSLPEIQPVSDSLTTSAGSSINIAIKAKSPIETNTPTITYIGTTLPRGASINAETGVFTWKPTDSQVGDNHVAITARDSEGRENTVHFTVTVYGSTMSKLDETEKDPPVDAPPAGGGGGATPDNNQTDVGDGGSDVPKDENTTQSDENETGENAPEASGETDGIRFTDLTNYAWAADAINALAADGIIKGTSASTFAPQNNITRADFALLLVRAFNLTSDNTENFADIRSDDYFASELAIARNNGIISGIGDNRFAPRNTITRQDMMVIVYRALQKTGVGFGIYDEPQNEDYATVADYARDAVTNLIGANLVNGKKNLIAPTDYTTRAEVAVLIKRILEFIK